MRKALSIFILCVIISGCSLARIRPVVLTGKDAVYGLILGEPYNVINMDGKKETIKFEQEMMAVSASSMVGYEERKNKKFFKHVKFTKRSGMVGGSFVFILGILYRIMVLKKKSDKGEEINWTDIINVFKKPVKKKK